MEDRDLKEKPLTDFGFEKVRWQEKKKRVHSVFDSVHQKYDLMNDIMSFGYIGYGRGLL